VYAAKKTFDDPERGKPSDVDTSFLNPVFFVPLVDRFSGLEPRVEMKELWPIGNLMTYERVKGLKNRLTNNPLTWFCHIWTTLFLHMNFVCEPLNTLT
jgi:hypothetical protein